MKGDGSSNEIEKLRSVSGILRSGMLEQSHECRPEVVGFNTEPIKKSLNDRQPICTRSLNRSGSRRSLRGCNITTQLVGRAPRPVTRRARHESASSRSSDQCPERRTRTRQ